jgi:acyl carrier protein
LEPDFLQQLPGDSLDRVELIMALEEKFNIEIPDEDAKKFRTVRDALDYIERHEKVDKRKKGGHLN